MLGIGAVVLLLAACVFSGIEVEKYKEEIAFLKEQLQPSNAPIYQQMLLNNVSLSSEVYHSYAKNKGHWNKQFSHPTLVYRYPEHMCRGCYYESLEILLRFQEEIGKENILLLPAYEESRDSRIKLKNELGKHNYIN